MADTTLELSASVVRRFKEEQVIWLTTVRADGMPQPTPVWYYWDGENFLIFSQPKAKKLANIRQNPKVALNFNSDADGGNVLIVFGHAHIEPGSQPVQENSAYVEKYRQGIADIGMTPESMGNEYSVAIRITPERLRSF